MGRKSIRVRQRDYTDCGAACVAAICAYHGHHVPVSRIRELAGTDAQGTSVFGLTTAAEKLGLLAKAVRTGSVYLSDIPLPAIAHVMVDAKISHYMVLASVKNAGFELMDPTDGRIKAFKRKEFLDMWSGVLVLMMPGDNFIPSGRKSETSRFYALIKPHKRRLITATLLAIFISLLGLLTSFYIREITDTVLPNGRFDLLTMLSLGMLASFVIQAILGVTRNMLVLKAGQKIDAQIVMEYFTHVMRLPQRFLDSMQVGELISRVNDAVRISAFVNEIAISVVVNGLVLLFSTALMFFFFWKLALIMLLMIPLYVVLFYINDRVNRLWQRKIMESGAELEGQLVDSLSSATIIKNLRLEQYCTSRIEYTLKTLLQKSYTSSRYQFYIHFITDLISKGGVIVILWSGTYYIVKGQLTQGELLSFFTLISFFTAPLLVLLEAGKSLRDARIAADRLFEIIDLESEVNFSRDEIAARGVDCVEFKNVCFSYTPANDILKNVNLCLQRGSITGVTGKSGCGKSTLAAMLQNLYHPDEGTIRINGKDLRTYNNQSIRTAIVCVPQSSFLFKGTILENITIGLDQDMDKVTTISEELGLMEYVSQLPDGFQTLVYTDGSNLSGGQRQKICLARALYRDPSLLILDETTSSLDAQSEREILAAVDVFRRKGNTVLIIAHRLTTLEFCDSVIILENGTTN